VLAEILTSTDQKIIVFSQWTRTLEIVADLCKRKGIGYVTYTGRPEDKRVAKGPFGNPIRLSGERVLQRDYNEHRWKNDPSVQAMLASTSAGGIGLNWTEAGVMVRMDKLWVPDDNDQARDRMHRFGQTKSTTLIDILAEKTVEEKIEKMLNFRSSVNGEITELFRTKDLKSLI
jgi:transcription termination factor 2